MAENKTAEAASPGKIKRLWSWLNRPSAAFSLLTLVAGGFVLGIIFWGGFNTAMEMSNKLDFCISCHEMRDNVYAEYTKTIHYTNRSGVRAVCSDCHVPNEWGPKVVRKVKASNEVFHWLLGSINTPEKFDAKRPQLARNEWARMKSTDSRECRNCHDEESMNPVNQQPRSRNMHVTAMETGQTCIDCHKGIAHNGVRDLIPIEELEQIEAAQPWLVKPVPEAYREGLKIADERDRELEQKAKLEKLAIEQTQKVKIDQAVAVAVAKARAEAAAAQTDSTPTAPAAAGDSGFDIDWASIDPNRIAVFYPGQASFEWTQGREHSGSRAFLKGGDACAVCHAREVRDMGQKIVTGEKLEPTPIPGKRPYIDVDVRAAHDADNLYLRFEWEDTAHAPVPFVEGGKMDPENQVKVAYMLAGTGIERVEQAGCWTTCHTDSRSMPDADKVDPSTLPFLQQSLMDAALADGLTKYLPESRTDINIKGGADTIHGGGVNIKTADEIAELLKAGTFMDLVRARSGGAPENGHIVAQRYMEGGASVEAEVDLEGGKWVATIKRPLKSDQPGDISIEPGKIYTFGFAIHDDYSNARFHHVSVNLRLGLDNPEAEVNVIGK